MGAGSNSGGMAQPGRSANTAGGDFVGSLIDEFERSSGQAVRRSERSELGRRIQDAGGGSTAQLRRIIRNTVVGS